MKIVEAIELAGHKLQSIYFNNPIPRMEIVNEVVKECGCKPGSVIPSDYCYNLCNEGIPLDHPRFFLHEGKRNSGLYKFVGGKFSYDGPILHYPKGKKSDPVEIKGRYEKGKFIKG